jgi:hypothetical protein
MLLNTENWNTKEQASKYGARPRDQPYAFWASMVHEGACETNRPWQSTPLIFFTTDVTASLHCLRRQTLVQAEWVHVIMEWYSDGTVQQASHSVRHNHDWRWWTIRTAPVQLSLVCLQSPRIPTGYVTRIRERRWQDNKVCSFRYLFNGTLSAFGDTASHGEITRK